MISDIHTEKDLEDYLLEEEHDLSEKSPELYSYYAGWNNALKRAFVLTKGLIRPQSVWIWHEEWTPSSPSGPAECDSAGWVCNNCGQYPTEDYVDLWDDPDKKPNMKFCPNCGAAIRDEAEIVDYSKGAYIHI